MSNPYALSSLEIAANEYKSAKLQKSTNSRMMLVLGILILVIGCNCGWLGYLLFGDFAANTKILYVSNNEIMNFERERIKTLSARPENKASNSNEVMNETFNTNSSCEIPNNNEQAVDHSNIQAEISNQEEDLIFYGRTNEALELIRAKALAYESEDTKVILVSEGFISGKDVTSISNQVYEEVLNKLQSSQNPLSSLPRRTKEAK